jgi:serine/threonine-protein kinase RsbW
VPYLISLPAKAAMVAIARQATKCLLGDDPRTPDAVLIVSELVTNSIRHSASGAKPGGTVRITLKPAPAPETLRIEVEDDGCLDRPQQGSREAPCEPEFAEFGRGITVLDALAAKWGQDAYDDRGVTWAELT